MAVSSKYTQDLSVQIVFFTFSCKWFLCFYSWAVIWSYTVDLFAALHELASASARTLLKLASSVRVLLKPYGDTLSLIPYRKQTETHELILSWLSWLVVLLVACVHVCDSKGDNSVMQDGGHTPANRLIETRSLGL